MDFHARLAETPQALERWLGTLADAGADAFHLSQQAFGDAGFPEFDDRLNLAGWAKKLTGVPAITVGSVGLSGDVADSFKGKSADPAPLDDLLARLERDEFDLVAVGRPLLQDAAWVRKVREHRCDEIHGFAPKAFETLG